MSIPDHFIGVDVGTGSVRASLLSKDGKIVASSTQNTRTWRDDHDHRIFEQSTNDIWSAISRAIKACLADSKVPPEHVKGLGFDATCSLAVADLQGEPVTVTKGNDIGLHGERNIVLWADHRAEKEADLINGTGSVVLDYVGGRMSVRPTSSAFILFLTIYAVGNGGSENSLAEEKYARRPFLQLSILRSPRFFDIPRYQRQYPFMLLCHMQMLVCTKDRMA
jgi:hypothetical protein